MNNNGYTIVEVLIAMSVLGAVSVAGIASQMEENEKAESIKFINEAVDIVSAVDTRLSVDGYDENLWVRRDWSNENEIVNFLISQQLNPVGSSCSGGNWTPELAIENNSKLISCNQWENRIDDGIEMSARLNSDAVGYIESFELFLSFDSNESFDEGFGNFKRGINSINSKVYNELTGIYFFDLINRTTNEEIATSECLIEKTNCALKLSLERAGGNEYLRLDGSNSMINSHLTFVETKGHSPLSCVRWRVDSSGAWTNDNTPIQDCGVGIYSETGMPAVVDVAADNGTFINILLDQSCNVYKEGSGNKVVPDGTSPCGMKSDTEAIQVVDTLQSKFILSEEGVLNIARTESLIVGNLTTNNINATDFTGLNIEIENDLTVGGDLSVSGAATVSGNASTGGDLNSSSNIRAREITGDYVTAPNGSFANIDTDLRNVETALAGIETGVNNLKGSWILGSWGTCSKSCGGGYQTRTVSCETGKFCNGSVPSTTQSCNTNSCPTPPAPSYGCGGMEYYPANGCGRGNASGRAN
jgi:prepilin-type N-terminal cleavage/methylation domain-containing protein